MRDDDCPFDLRLARTPYLVMPKMAIQAMPREWRERLEALLLEAEEAGLETPEYHVFRDDGEGEKYPRSVGELSSCHTRAGSFYLPDVQAHRC